MVLSIKRLLLLISVLALAAETGCSKNNASDTSADDSEMVAKGGDSGFLEAVASAVLPEWKTVPKGTPIRVRLTQTVSTDTDRSGDEFTAVLDDSIGIDGEVLAPEGSKVVGELPFVEGSK